MFTSILVMWLLPAASDMDITIFRIDIQYSKILWIEICTTVSECIWHKNSKLLPESQSLASMAGYEPFNVSKVMTSVTKKVLNGVLGGYMV